MKRSAYYYLSFVAIMTGCLVSCQEDDMGYTSEEIALDKIKKEYEKNFVSEFGEPAPGHQWGFDLAQKSFSGLNQTRNHYKQEWEYVNDVKARDYFINPSNITDLEHQEVYAWFSNHRVNWSVSPTNAEDPNSRKSDDGIAHEINKNFNYGTIVNPPHDYEMITQFESNFAWVQHVACDTQKDEFERNGNTGEYDKPSSATGSSMNYLAFSKVGSVNDWEHINDFNASSGYGYGNQSDPNNGGQNAELVTDCNFNNFQYKCSVDGSVKFHNKWYMVYLKGQDYEGWYLGMDIEGLGSGANNNEFVKANGICNDWIIKLGEVLPKPEKVQSWRIMCEDLGSSLDIDFNDIVYDLSFNGSVAFISLQAAGGTLPIKVKYKDHFITSKTKDEIHAMFGKETTTPVNVKAPSGADNLPPVSWSFTTSSFDVNDVKIFVGTSEATELDIQKLDSETKLPYRICVPTTVRWCQECKPINTVYKDFRDWVTDPTDYFWKEGKTINTSLLY